MILENRDQEYPDECAQFADTGDTGYNYTALAPPKRGILIRLSEGSHVEQVAAQ